MCLNAVKDRKRGVIEKLLLIYEAVLLLYILGCCEERCEKTVKGNFILKFLLFICVVSFK